MTETTGESIAYFDCFNGAAGDMILGALISAGLKEEDLRADLARLALADYELRIEHVRRHGLAAVKVDVHMTGKPGHRHLHHITRIVDESTLPEPVKATAKRVFTRLAEAEARVHGTTIEKVHFHEVGAVDAIVDVVGAAAGIHRLGVGSITCSPIPTGSGTVQCEHGIMPVPAPATAELLVGVPIAETSEPGELTTPTGAAILTSLARHYGPPPTMRIDRIGYGAGTREGKTRPNLLRLMIGSPVTGGAGQDEVVVLETNLDDTTGEEIGCAMEALFGAGALDVFAIPLTMKKSRPGVLLSAIVPPEHAAACEDVMFAQTNTFGIRRHVCHRSKLARETLVVSTTFGDIRVKVGSRGGARRIVAPEYEDCAAAARKAGVPLRDVLFAARQAAEPRSGGAAS